MLAKLMLYPVWVENFSNKETFLIIMARAALITMIDSEAICAITLIPVLGVKSPYFKATAYSSAISA